MTFPIGQYTSSCRVRPNFVISHVTAKHAECSRTHLQNIIILCFISIISYNNCIVARCLISIVYITACCLYQVMMTLHFLCDVAYDAESTQKSKMTS